MTEPPAVASAYFEPGYFRWQAAGAERSAEIVVPLLTELLSPTSAADIGCGTGAWLQVLSRHGVERILGVDGPYIDRDELRIPAESFRAQDLARPLEVAETFDLALSLEAAHYLPAETAPLLVRSLTELAPVVLFSAAVPGQSGGPGLNRQWPRYWCDLFERHGFRAFDWLRPRIWEDDRVDWWYAQNAILFVREDRAGSIGGLETGRVLPLVHPQLLRHCLESGTAAPPSLTARLAAALRRRR